MSRPLRWTRWQRRTLYERYNNLIGGKTSVFISHRLSSTQVL